MKLPSSHNLEPGNFFIILHRSSDCLTTYRGLSVFFVKPTAFFICPQFLSFFIFAEENKLLKERITKSKSSPNEKTYVTQNVNNSDGPDFIPNMEVFTVGEDVTPKGAVIICPGGAFQFRSIMQNEGYDVADMLVPMGYQCFIVNYRIAPYTMRESATDLQRAIRLLPRSYALVNLWGGKRHLLQLPLNGCLCFTSPQTFERRPGHSDYQCTRQRIQTGCATDRNRIAQTGTMIYQWLIRYRL